MKIMLNQYLLLCLILSACTKGSGVKEGQDSEAINNSSGKNVLIMEFVSFDCVYCPSVTEVLKIAANEKFPNRIDIISVHGRLEEEDPMEFKGYKQFQNYFYNITGYPAVIVDQREDLVTVGSFDATTSSFLSRFDAVSPVGISISTLKTSDDQVQIVAGIANNKKNTANYRLAVAVLENKIIYKQADLVDGGLQWIDNYEHNHVLRAFLSENYFGDLIGTLVDDEIYSKKFTYSVPNGVNIDNLSVVAYVVEAKGFSDRVVLNSRSVDIGQSVTF
ncbi:Omp28-related outer membrane protein [Sphingobacterium sp. LRF_L2]|uniref:Omp28-related outer membrane protein n=1 Tax=Sphingobacterium sp. LRF_L2 TaxID=3369421 RepID=UPI003F5E2A30